MKHKNRKIIVNGFVTYVLDDGSVYHREDGPAVYDETQGENAGWREWWYLGKRHRIGGPAIDQGDGTKDWYKDGKMHRLDGPAVVRGLGSALNDEYWIDGKYIGEVGYPEDTKAYNKEVMKRKLTGKADAAFGDIVREML